MSRDPYGGRAPQRFDGERFTRERDTYEETRGGGYGGRPQERVVDEVYERRSGNGRVYEDDRVRERDYYDEGSRHRPRRESVTIEKEREREVYSPPAAQRAPPRPGLLRRQSSLDTFDRKPFPRYQREEYGPPALRSDYRPAYERPAPIPRYRQLAPPPPRRYAERDYEEIKIADGDDDYRPYPERVVEREVIRTRRRTPSPSVSSRASSVSSVSSEEVVVKKFPRRGKTRMPARLVSIKAIIELGYPYEKEGDVIIIQKALGPENIDEVIRLSEIYKKAQEPEMSGGRSEGGNIVEEHREEIIDIPAGNGRPEIIEKRIYDSHRHLSPPRSRIGRSRSVGPAPVIVDAREPYEVIDRTSYAPAGPLVLLGNKDSRDSRAVKAEIRALEYEREAMKAEAKAQLELRRADKIREYGRNGELVMYDELKVKKDRLDPDVIIKVKREKEPDEGVSLRKEAKKAAQARAIRTMLTTLT